MFKPINYAKSINYFLKKNHIIYPGIDTTVLQIEPDPLIISSLKTLSKQY
jgi:hypothetical protein